jgi:hypothetical protein
MRIEVREDGNGASGRSRDWLCGPIFPNRFRSIYPRGDELEEKARAPDPHDGRTPRRENTHSPGTARSTESNPSRQESQGRCDGLTGQGNHGARARERIIMILDIVFVACTAAFFLIALTYVWACDRLN